MRGTGPLLRADTSMVWGRGRHTPVDNTFGYFLDTNGNPVKYSIELQQLNRTPGTSASMASLKSRFRTSGDGEPARRAGGQTDLHRRRPRPVRRTAGLTQPNDTSDEGFLTCLL